MTRKEFIKFTQTGQSKGKKCMITGKSVTDPTFARTGRQLIFSPLNIEYRMKYPDGVPLDKDNPHNFKEFDKLYPDTFKAIQQAKADVKNTKSKLEEISKKHKKESQQPTNQPT